MTAQPHLLDDPEPLFLELLDSRPDKAADLFVSFTLALLRLVPPPSLAGLESEDKEEFANEFVLHCLKDNFYLLRTYHNRGRPFANWLFVVANHYALTFRRSRLRQAEKTVGVGPDDVNPDELSGTGGSWQLALDRVVYEDLLRHVQHALNKLPVHCRVLVKMAAEEMSPKEMLDVLREPRNQEQTCLTGSNPKEISDRLRYCRVKLLKLLEAQGINLQEYLRA